MEETPVTYRQIHFTARLTGGEKVFIKAVRGARAAGNSRARSPFGMERACLKRLRSLAVPRLRGLPASRIDAWAGAPMDDYIVQSHAGDRELQTARLTPAQRLGLWVFVAEQVVAFRRRGILYADFKPQNVVVRERPLAATLVDFGTALRWAPGRTLPAFVAFTPGAEAPEQFAGGRVSERSLVYQCGMLLASTLVRVNNQNRHHPVRGTARLAAAMRRLGASSLQRTVRRCLSLKAAERPRDFEALWEAIARAGIPAPAERVWRELRAPYARGLSEVGL